ncbi:MAG: procyclic acidic repetitive family protein [Alphaproteobacteria bacterium]|nr:procyclic acidic repetitive family protein [Alphaproteobacteria bacterium]
MPFRKRKKPSDLLKSVMEQDASLKETLTPKEEEQAKDMPFPSEEERENLDKALEKETALKEQEAAPEESSFEEKEEEVEAESKEETEEKAEADVEVKSEAEAEAEPEVEPEVEPEAEVEAETETEEKVGAKVEAETAPEPEMETEPETAPEGEAEIEETAEPEVETESEPEVETESEPEVETESEPEVETESEPEIETEPETKEFTSSSESYFEGKDDSFVPSTLITSSFDDDEEEEEEALSATEEESSEIAFSFPKNIPFIQGKTYSFSYGRGQEVLSNMAEEKTILLENYGALKGYTLRDWYLVLIDLKTKALKDYAGKTLPLSKEAVQNGLLVGPDNVTVPFMGAEEVDIPNSFDFPLSEVKPQHFLLGALGFNSFKDWGIILNGLRVLNMGDKQGQELSFNGETALLIGPENSVLYISNLKKLSLPEETTDSMDTLYPETMLTPENKKGYFFFKAGDDSQKIEGSLETSGIVIKADAKGYGWHVAFESGLEMSLLDVVEYQKKNHFLPDAAGTIFYGNTTLEFSKITEISLYTETEYCKYSR